MTIYVREILAQRLLSSLLGHPYHWKNKAELLPWGEVESVPSTDAFASITFPWFSTLLSTGITEVSCVGLDGTFGVTLMSKEREKK